MTPPSPAASPLPALDPPGAGLPPYERRFSLVLLATFSAMTPRLGALRRFEREAARIVQLVQPLSAAVGKRQVLVPRLTGLEDRSRYWSPFMVVEHLVIVDDSMLRILTDLVAGRRHPAAARIENFKPPTTADRGSLLSFQRLVEEFRNRVST